MFFNSPKTYSIDDTMVYITVIFVDAKHPKIFNTILYTYIALKSYIS